MQGGLSPLRLVPPLGLIPEDQSRSSSLSVVILGTANLWSAGRIIISRLGRLVGQI